MSQEQVVDELLKETFTLEDFRKKYHALKTAVEHKLYQKDKKDEDLEGVDTKLVEEIKSEDFTKLNDYVEEFIKNTQTLSIYFVFIPDKAQLKEIGGWLRTNLKNPRLIFDIKVDASLIGGCAIAYKGVYKDYSLKARITENKSKLIEEFRKYFRQ